MDYDNLSEPFLLGLGIGAIFLPSDLKIIYSGLELAVSDGFLDSTKPFCDMGSGDGRVVYLVSNFFNIDSLGIEYKDDLVKRSKLIANDLNELNLLNSNYQEIVKGDFSTDIPFYDVNVDFDKVGIFFNYINNHNLVARRFSKGANDESVFILLSDLVSNKNSFSNMGLNMV